MNRSSFEKAIELNPKEASYYTAKASALAGLGRQAEALLDYGKAIELKPTDPNNWVSKGYALNSMGSLTSRSRPLRKQSNLIPKKRAIILPKPVLWPAWEDRKKLCRFMTRQLRSSPQIPTTGPPKAMA